MTRPSVTSLGVSAPVVVLTILVGILVHKVTRNLGKPVERGLKTMAGSDVEEPEILIVAVHGLGARPEYTWSVKGDVDESANVDGDASNVDRKPKLKKGQVDWLSDSRFLKTDFPRAVVMRFAHNADWLFGAPSTTAQKTGIDLLEHLNDKRQTFNGHLPPVLFIGHSFGGIVVKTALMQARLNNNKYGEILEATCGIIFLGTPHQGAALSTPAIWLAGLLSLFGSKTMLLKSLQSHDEDLINLQDSFISVISDLPDPLKDHVWSFYETLDTYYLKVVSGGRVVTEDSAKISGFTHNKSMEASHKKLNKYASPSDPNYGKLKAAIKDIREFSKSHSYTKVHKKQELVKRLEGSVVASTSPAEPAVNVDASPILNWLDDNRKYCEWRQTPLPSAPYLWCVDKWSSESPAGPTIVQQLQGCSDNTKFQDIVFYIYRGSHPTVNNILCSFIRQLAQRRLEAMDVDLMDEILSVVSPQADELSPESLWNTTKKILLLNVNRSVSIVIEGIDGLSSQVFEAFAVCLHRLFGEISAERTEARLPRLNLRSIMISKNLAPRDVIERIGVYSIDQHVVEYNELERGCLAALHFQQREPSMHKVDSQAYDWLFTDTPFQEWLSPGSSDSVFWILGKPGAGKSTLMKHAIERLQQGEFAANSSYVIVFFFNGRASEEQRLQKTTVGLYRSLLYQLLEKYPWQMSDVVQAHADAEQKFKGIGWTTDLEKLEQLLQAGLRKVLQRISIQIFVDALDECEEKDTRDRLLSLVEYCCNCENRLSLCISRQFEPSIIGTSDLCIHVEERNTPEVIKYITQELRDSQNSYKLDAVRQSIMNRARGVFQWLRLVVARVRSNYEMRDSEDDLLTYISELPEKLEVLYGEILNKCLEDQDHSEKTVQLFNWVYLSLQPLTVTELQHAMGFRPSTMEYDRHRFRTEIDITAQLQVLSGGLIELWKNRIQLSHQSVHDYLGKKGFAKLQSSDEPYARIVGQVHLRLASYCILYFSQSDAQNAIQELAQWGEFQLDGHPSLKKFPFVRYALTQWPEHARFAEEHKIPSLDLLKYLHSQSSKVQSLKAPVFWAADGNAKQTSLLHLAARFNLFSIVSSLYTIAVDNGSASNSFEVNEDPPIFDLRDDNGRTPLSIAAGCGNNRVVELILGPVPVINIDSIDDFDRTPLAWAAANGHVDMVELLLKEGAELNSRDSSGWTPLALAVVYIHEAVVKVLIENEKVDLKTVDDNGRTPLSLAAMYGNEAMMKLLLPLYGNTVTARPPPGDTVDPDSQQPDSPAPLFQQPTDMGGEALAKRLLVQSDTAKVLVYGNLCQSCQKIPAGRLLRSSLGVPVSTSSWGPGPSVRADVCEICGPAEIHLDPLISIPDQDTRLTVLPRPGSELQFFMIKEWLRSCDRNHNHFTPFSSLPKRVLDVGNRENPGPLRLYVTMGEKRPYTAVAHVYGDISGYYDTLTTTKRNLAEKTRGIDFQQLPKTLQDAITVTRELGIQYLWTDSLCMIRDDINDQMSVVASFEQVFASAYCTIAPFSRLGDELGFLRPRGGRPLDSPFGRGRSLEAFRMEADYVKDVEQGPLSSRAWVFQELALSRRVIHFTANQTYWECETIVASESTDEIDLIYGQGDDYLVRTSWLTPPQLWQNNRPPNPLRSSRFPICNSMSFREDDPAAFQYTFTHYSRLQLTHYSDRPFAIAGLEKRLALFYKTRSVYGVLERFLYTGLLWHRGSRYMTSLGANSNAPSWSWMSYSGEINYNFIPANGLNYNKHVRLNHSGSNKHVRLNDFGFNKHVRLDYVGSGHHDWSVLAPGQRILTGCRVKGGDIVDTFDRLVGGVLFDCQRDDVEDGVDAQEFEFISIARGPPPEARRQLFEDQISKGCYFHYALLLEHRDSTSAVYRAGIAWIQDGYISGTQALVKVD